MEAQAQRQTGRRSCGAAGERSPGFYKADPRVGGSACAAAEGSPAGCKRSQMTSRPTVQIRINPTLDSWRHVRKTFF